MATTNPPHIVVSGVSTGAPVAQTSATTEDAPESKLAVESQMMSDFMFGGSILVVVVMFHAFATRYITSVFLQRSQTLTAHAAPWRANLRMHRVGKPLADKLGFELMSLAVSAIGGCEMCVKSHEAVVTEGGLTRDQVHDAVRIAAVMQGVAVALDQ